MVGNIIRGGANYICDNFKKAETLVLCKFNILIYEY